MSSHGDQERKEPIPRGTFFLLLVFLVLLAGLWANVYLRIIWRA